MTEKHNGTTVQTYNATYDNANRITRHYYEVSPSWNGTLNNGSAYTYTYRSSDGALTNFNPPGSCSYVYSYDALKRLTQSDMNRHGSVFLRRNYSYLAGSGSNTSTLVSGLNIKLNGSTSIRNYSYS